MLGKDSQATTLGGITDVDSNQARKRPHTPAAELYAKKNVPKSARVVAMPNVLVDMKFLAITIELSDSSKTAYLLHFNI